MWSNYDNIDLSSKVCKKFFFFFEFEKSYLLLYAGLLGKHAVIYVAVLILV